MAEYPIIDGHNDTLLRFYKNDDISYADFLSEMDSGHIDLARARRGGFRWGLLRRLHSQSNTRYLAEQLARSARADDA